MTALALPNEPIWFSADEIERLLIFAAENQVSDITLQTRKPVFVERAGKLGALTRRLLEISELGEIINNLYGANAVTQLSAGKDLDFSYAVRHKRASTLRFRVNATPILVDNYQGIQVTIRIIPSVPPDLATLAVEPCIEQGMAPSQGLILVTGPTGSGKSTLLAAMMKELVKQPDSHRKVLTYEAPIEYTFDAIDSPTAIISQTEIPTHLPSFGLGVRNAMRRKPMAILVGEARDPETIGAVIEASLTGHTVYSTVHSNGVAETVRRMINVFPPGERNSRAVDLLESLRMIITQNLIRDTQGGRVAIREILVFTEQMRDRLLRAELHQIGPLTRELVERHGQPMIRDARAKLEAGLIALREFKVIEAGVLGAQRDLEARNSQSGSLA